MASTIKIRSKFFPRSPLDLALSGIVLILVIWAAWRFLDWAVFKAVWDAKSAAEGSTEGATWAFVIQKFGLFMFGFYPSDSWWRVVLAFVLMAMGLVPLAIKKFNKKALWFGAYLLLAPFIAWYLIAGGPGLPTRSPTDLGGLSLTLLISVLGLILSFPLGIVLALGRRSKLPVVRALSVGYIEFFRGIPLITILFMMSVAVPFFLPQGFSIDKMVRIIIGFTVFQSAYLAEVIRGGLQAISPGQYEAADSLGFSYFHKQYLIILPQALRNTVANIGGISISFVKDTTLVLIIGMFDLLGIVKPLTSDPLWLSMEPEGLLFAGMVYWGLCFGVSQLTKSIEKAVNTLPTTQELSTIQAKKE